jgi:hypothetical protein
MVIGDWSCPKVIIRALRRFTFSSVIRIVAGSGYSRLVEGDSAADEPLEGNTKTVGEDLSSDSQRVAYKADYQLLEPAELHEPTHKPAHVFAR